MKKYTQLCYEERVLLAELLRKGKSNYYIANWLKRKYDTITNEIQRNGTLRQDGSINYLAKKAQKKAEMRRILTKENTRIIENNPKIEARIIALITGEDHSPEQVAGRYETVSHQTIYNWIHRMEDMSIKKKVVSHLRRKGKAYRHTSKLHKFDCITAPKTMIDERPGVINSRGRLGDFEGDTVLLNGLERLYTLVDRLSGYSFVRHIPNGHAQTIQDMTLKISQEYPGVIKSLTYDNGVEFSYHDLISLDTGIPIYFAFPYHSWERGTNENTNGLLRQYFPKKEITGTITQSDIIKIETKLNHRPRKRLSWLTPYEVFILGMKSKDFQVQSLI
jgi:IS30 family transposase